MSKWRDYLALGRPSNLPTVWSNVIAGTVLADPAEALTSRLVLLVLAISCMYTGGMFSNDAFDREIDARERPERPIPSGRVSAREAFAIGGALIAAGIALTGVYGRGFSPIIAACVLALAIVVYDAWHKKNPIAPFIMGTCRGLVYVTAGACATGEVSAAVSIGAGVLAMYVVGLTFVARQENLASFKGFWPLVFLAGPAVYGVWGVAFARGGLWGSIALVAFIAWACSAIALLVKKEPGNIPRAVVRLIAGISLVDAIVVAASGRAGIAIFCALGCFLTLKLQRWVRGT